MTVVTVTARGSHHPKIVPVAYAYKVECECGWHSWITNDRGVAHRWHAEHGAGSESIEVALHDCA